MHVRISGSGLTPKMKTYKKLPPNGLVHESDIKYKKINTFFPSHSAWLR